ncbi:MAG: hypothetical protein GC152_05360 [Alphaproteobacteria bacterium]|nr:hypothetical protein [Alphaproteobacteria bacterium]
MKIVARVRDVNEAHLIVGYLEANGVTAAVYDAAMASLNLSFGGARIAVDEDQAPKARALLREKGVALVADD